MEDSVTSEVSSEKPQVELWAMSQGIENISIGPEELSVFSAMADFASETSKELYEKHKKAKTREEFEKLKERILAESSGRGHGSVDDQNQFHFVIKNLTRVATLMLCGPEYLQHEQQSFRRVKPGNLFYIPEALQDQKQVAEIGIEAFMLYSKMVQGEIPEEDARNVIPLFAKTNITTSGNSRELKHFLQLTSMDWMPSLIRDDVASPMYTELMKVAPKLFTKRSANYEVLGWWPSPVLFAPSNVVMKQIIDEADSPKKPVFISHNPLEEIIQRALVERDEPVLSMLKHSHNGLSIEGYLVPMSLSCFHQMTRQRTLNQAVESVYDAAERATIVIPPKIERSNFRKEYLDQNEKMISLYHELISVGVLKQEAIGIIPHSLEIYDLLHVNGVNAYLFIGKRACKEAQWEIRGIANDICEDIKAKNPIYENIAAAQGTILGQCPERDMCPSFSKTKKCPAFPGTNSEIFYNL